MKSVALKRSDRLRTQILGVVWGTVCTLFMLIPLFITVINAFKSKFECLFYVIRSIVKL